MQTYVPASARVKPLYRATQLVWYLLGIVEALLAFRFLLKLLGANSAAGFTQFVYSLTQPFVAPFLRVFRIPSVEGYVFEWASLIAMGVYWLLAWAVVKLLVMGKPVTTTEADLELRREDH